LSARTKTFVHQDKNNQTIGKNLYIFHHVRREWTNCFVEIILKTLYRKSKALITKLRERAGKLGVYDYI